MIIKELSNLKVFPVFIKHLTQKEVNIKEFIQSDEENQIGYFLNFIDSQGITIMATNYFIQFAYNRNSNYATSEEKSWIPIEKYTITFNKYINTMESIKIAIIKAFELIMPF